MGAAGSTPCTLIISGRLLATLPARAQPRSTRPAWLPYVTPNWLDRVLGWDILRPNEPLTRLCYSGKGQRLSMPGLKLAPGHLPPTALGGCRTPRVPNCGGCPAPGPLAPASDMPRVPGPWGLIHRGAVPPGAG